MFEYIIALAVHVYTLAVQLAPRGESAVVRVLCQLITWLSNLITCSLCLLCMYIHVYGGRGGGREGGREGEREGGRGGREGLPSCKIRIVW